MDKEEEDKIIKQRDKWFRDNINWLEQDLKHKICKTTGTMVDYAGDLLQVAVLQFLKKPLEVQYQMISEEKAGWYILVTCTRHIQSSTSPFYNEVRKFKMSTRSGALPELNNEDDPGADPFAEFEWYQCFKREMNTMSFYHKQLLLDKYQDCLTFEEIQKKYNITKNSLVQDIKNALQFLRCRCDNNCI
jgi:DNA-directed RNA polymerase specialized sigma24 family protein